jgi:hypothetical protein
MLIIWGTKVNQDPRGAVADKCSVCADVQLFDVTDHYEVSHIYFIPLGRGTRVATTRACIRCGTEFHCEPDSYDDYLTPQESDDLSIEEIVERTNTALGEARARRQQLEDMAYESKPIKDSTQVALPGTPIREAAPSALDQELRKVLARLEMYEDRGPDVAEMLKKLGRWRKLDDDGRAKLLEQAEAYVEKQEHSDRALGFIADVAQGFPQYAGCLPALALVAVLASAYWWSPIGSSVCLSGGYAVIGLALAAGLFYYLGSVRRRHWFRSVLIPKADAEGVDLKIVVTTMISLARSKQPIVEIVRTMSQDARVLRDLLKSMGRWDMAANEEE